MTPSPNTQRNVIFVMASLRFSGGVIEALRLAEELQSRGFPLTILVIWRCDHELPCPNLPVVYLSAFRTNSPGLPLQYLYLLSKFLLLAAHGMLFGIRRPSAIFLTHFSTFPFGWIAPWARTYCFNQDIEWMFVPTGTPRTLLRWIILCTSRRASIVTTNAYVDALYRANGVASIGQAAIWARREWLLPAHRVHRDIDVVVIVRRGHMKRFDLYSEVLPLLHQQGLITFAIAPDPDIHAHLLALPTHAVLRPTDDELRAIYTRSSIFLLLSDTEGFALPPLEAMGAGCVPLCRDSGGPRCYMDGPFAANLISVDEDSGQIAQRIKTLLADPHHMATLSAEARNRFAQGLNDTLQQRAECMDALAQHLRHP